MRAIGCWLKRSGIKVINNVRWGDKSTYDYCFSGIPKHDIICIGTIGCIKEKKYWELYKSGLDEMMKRLEPKILLVYGNVPDKATFLAKFNEFELVDVEESDKYLIDKIREEYNYYKARDYILNFLDYENIIVHEYKYNSITEKYKPTIHA